MTPSIVPAAVDLDRRRVSGSRLVPATPQEIFDLLADPRKHALIDGSGSVRGSHEGSPHRLSMGAKFGMKMRLIVPYRITNTVTEFDEPKLIEWRHLGNHRWRYELEPVDGGTIVTESFDWAPATLPNLYYTTAGFPDRNRKGIDATLERLAKHFTK